jgi:hypothetical protein
MNVGNILLVALLSYLFLMWFSLAVWVWNDVRERTKDSVFQYIALILAAVGNIFGVAVYLVIRPKETFAEAYFTQLEEKIILAQAKGYGIIDEAEFNRLTKKTKKRKA